MHILRMMDRIANDKGRSRLDGHGGGKRRVVPNELVLAGCTPGAASIKLRVWKVPPNRIRQVKKERSLDRIAETTQLSRRAGRRPHKSVDIY
jgi:hypothetical protein